MSWGERSCNNFGKCTTAINSNCNVNCINYTWDNTTKPDTNVQQSVFEIHNTYKKLTNTEGLNRKQRRALRK